MGCRQSKVEDITGTVTAVSQAEAAGGVKKNYRTEVAAVSSTVAGSTVTAVSQTEAAGGVKRKYRTEAAAVSSTVAGSMCKVMAVSLTEEDGGVKEIYRRKRAHLPLTVRGSLVAENTRARAFVKRGFKEEENVKEKKACVVLTQEDVVKHNATVPRETRWIPRDGHVYDSGKFLKCVGFINEVLILNFKYLNRTYGIKLSLIHKAKTLSCVGRYQVPTASELRVVYRRQLLSTREQLLAQPPRHNTPSFVLMKTTSGLQENSFTDSFVSSLREGESEESDEGDTEESEEGNTLMADICTRALMKLDMMYVGDSSGLATSKFCRRPGQDPSLVMFPLPWGVEPEELRSWLTTWQTFDLEVDEDGAWPMPAENVLGDSTVPSLSTLRPWLEGWEMFNTTITGDVAWEVAALEIVKEDVATEEQLAVCERRNAVPDFHSKARMAKRRQRMVERYFTGCLQMFDKFSERMERNLEELKELL